MSEVIIKGEVHSSRGDFEEERELLAEGVDTLVVEGSEDETEVGWLHGWFGIAMMIFEYLFASFLYTDHQTLVDIARGQGADVIYTRESDAALIENSHKLVVAGAFLMFYSLLILSAVVGVFGYKLYGAGILLMAGLGPILLLRIHESRKIEGNRDEKMAQKIEEAAANGGRVVAVLGNAHVENIPDYLSDEIDPEIREPNYGFFSTSMGRDLFIPAVRMIGMLAVVYPTYLVVFQTYTSFI